MSQDQYNWVYKRLVQGPNDTVGALAYVLYKEQKIAFIEETLAKEGREPDDAELKAFHRTSLLEESVKGYLERAEILAENFLEAALEKKLLQAEIDLRKSITSEEIKQVKHDLSKQVDGVLTELTGQKGWLGWFKDIGSNLAVNFGTILLIGALITGYKWMGDWGDKTEEKSGVASATSAKQADIKPPSPTTSSPRDNPPAAQ